MPDRSLRLPPLLLRERRPSPTPPREGDDVPEGGGQGSSGRQGSAGGQGSSGGQSGSGTPSGSGASGGSGTSGGSGGAPASGQRPEPPQSPAPPAPPAPPATPATPATPADDNPFAPPPEGTPDRPWQPRRPAGGQGDGQDGGGEGDGSPWGSQWSDRQPGPAQGGRFGDRPGANGGSNGGGSGGGPSGPEGSGGPGPGMRWDPSDPAQRRARYALLSGMWAFFFSLFNWPYVALLLGALALYWAISALRSKPRTPDPDTPAPASSGTRPQTTAAISGLVTASLALAMVAATFTAQLVYRDYYTCVNDSLTNTAKKSCDKLLPEELRGLLGTQN
ncbi:hypothetical protein [Streptomyces sp. NBC_00878]|uniref:hypothetical protein n=1 Tax=Streptomyces sp. NBC_00878 TaxID=2975854 RepID=UPI00224E3C41|nr:hypothetical protein [Streptomyces sp. NBC_00878]MCX4906005.1 hypothetical protein [Streptomyces sp. NBC_00878]